MNQAAPIYAKLNEVTTAPFDPVERLIHDAEHANSGACMAAMVHEPKVRDEFYAKRDQLLRAAIALDPQWQGDAWDEIDPDLRGYAAMLQLADGAPE